MIRCDAPCPKPPAGDRPAAPSSSDARALVEAIQLLVRRFSISERADVSCCGLTVAQAATLGTLRSAGPQRLGALGRRLGITPSTLTRNLDRLERSGLVERSADPEDRRATRVALSEAGRRAAERVERQEREFAADILTRIPLDRRAQLIESLDSLMKAVVGATEACCPGAFDHLLEGLPRSGPRHGVSHEAKRA